MYITGSSLAEIVLSLAEVPFTAPFISARESTEIVKIRNAVKTRI